jgi:hypothetical protein
MQFSPSSCYFLSNILLSTYNYASVIDHASSFLYTIHLLENIIRMIKLRRICMELANAYKIFIANPKGKRPLRRPRHTCEEMGSVWTGFIWLKIGTRDMLL